ncbi:MAG: NADH-quinone oxidoreductase subunit C [Planctomycetota bacterium]
MSMGKNVEANVKAKLGELSEAIFVRNEKRIYVDVPPENTLPANRIVFEEMGGRLATASGVDTRSRVEVLYHYCFDEAGVVVTLRTWAEKPDLDLDSVATIFPGAAFIEREIQDLLGVRFRGHPDPRRLILADDWPEGLHPLRKSFPKRQGSRPVGQLLEELVGGGAHP